MDGELNTLVRFDKLYNVGVGTCYYFLAHHVTDCLSGFNTRLKSGGNCRNCTLNNNEFDNFMPYTDRPEADIEAKNKNTLAIDGGDFGDTTFNDKCKVSGVGSIFGEGSLTNIIVIISLVTSIISICLTLNNKKKSVSATANNTAESEDKE